MRATIKASAWYDILMIRTISGTVNSVNEESAIIGVFGLGLIVRMPKGDLSSLKVGREITLHTYLALRENAADLYGFAEEETLHFFELLLGVSGVGPRSAINIADLAPVAVLSDAIKAKDISYLTRVAGVGKKMAEKIIVELKDKVEGSGKALLRDDDTEILDTLVALGYKEREAKDALHNIPETITNKDERLRAALRKS